MLGTHRKKKEGTETFHRNVLATLDNNRLFLPKRLRPNLYHRLLKLLDRLYRLLLRMPAIHLKALSLQKQVRWRLKLREVRTSIKGLTPILVKGIRVRGHKIYRITPKSLLSRRFLEVLGTSSSAPWISSRSSMMNFVVPTT